VLVSEDPQLLAPGHAGRILLTDDFAQHPGRVQAGEDSEIDLSPKPGHEQEFDAWRWVPHRELPELVVPFKRQVYEGVIREFERFVLASRR